MSIKVKILKPGEILFSEGDAYDGLYLIRAGKVEVFIHRERSDVILNQMGPGEIIGTLTLFSRKPRTASVRALTVTEVELRSTQSLDYVLQKDCPPWVSLILKDAVSRLQDLNERTFQKDRELKILRENVFTKKHFSVQFSRYLSQRLVKDLRDEGGFKFCPLINYEAECEHYFLQDANLFVTFLDIFNQTGLAKVQRYGNFEKVLVAPNRSLFEGYGKFVMDYLRNRHDPFIPIKYQKVLLSLSRYIKTLDENEKPQLILFSKFYEKEFKREFNVDWFWDLKEYKVLDIHQEKDTIDIHMNWILKRFRFERALVLVDELDSQPTP
jgi:CRP-like cAMP-binding protein